MSLNNILLIDEFEEALKDIETQEVKDIITNEDETERKIQSDDEANKILRQIGSLNIQIQEARECADSRIAKEIERIESCYKKTVSSSIYLVQYLTGLLEEYTREKLSNTKAKSINLPYGSLKIKKQQKAYTYDEDRILEFLKQNNISSYTKIKETVSLDKAKLKKDITIDDDNNVYINSKLIDGLTVEDREDKFEIKYENR